MNALLTMNQSQAESVHALTLYLQLYAMHNDQLMERQHKRQKTTRRRSVSFNDNETALFFIERVENKADVWYTREDYRSIHKDIMQAFNERLNGTFQESDKCTFSGLEKHLRRELQRKITKAQLQLQLRRQQEEQMQQFQCFCQSPQANPINCDI
jgi:hypothetical protein